MENTPSSIVCFKNGFSFVTVPVLLQEDESDEDIKTCTVGPLPSFAVHGTVGLEASNPEFVKIFSVSKAPKEDEELKLPAGPEFTYPSFMQANLGTYVRVQVKDENVTNHNSVRDYEGRVKWFEDGSKMAILETTVNKVKLDKLIDTSKIVHLERMMRQGQGYESSSLLVRYVNSGGSDPSTSLSYLTKGLTWAPSYSVLMDKESKTVKLEGKACLLCDLPYLDGGAIPEISLVAGEPNMKFQHLSDPLVSGVSASDFVSQLGGGRMAAPRMMRSQAFGGRSQYSQSNEVHEMEEAEGIQGAQSVEDFFHYDLKNVPLKFDHPMSIPFIDECDNIGYEDIYYLDLDKVSNSSSHNDDEQSSVEVKHAITFKNTSGQPLITAPVSVLAKTKNSSSKFLVQATMKYTGPAKNATIEITRSMDVESKFVVETMKERKTETINIGTEVFGTVDKKQYLDSIQKNAKVVIKNSKDVEIKCKIEHQLYGHLEESTPEVKDKTERQSNHQDLNPTTKYVWEIQVPANGKEELNFKFCIKEWNHALNNSENKQIANKQQS